MESKLKNEFGIRKALANPYTGNLLIHFEPDQTDLNQIIQNIDQQIQEATQPEVALEIRRQRIQSLRPSRSRQQRSAWHLQRSSAVIRAQKSSKKRGLTHSQAQSRLLRYGLNQTPSPPVRSSSEILVEQLANLPSILLLASAGISVLTGGLGDALMILGVVAANTCMGYVTESSAEDIVNILSQSKILKAQVIRDGMTQEVPAESIVVGDLLDLTPGSCVPADARLILNHSISADESLITGESLPILKTTKTLKGQNIPVGDRINMVFCGTMITGGNGCAVVVATGADTEIGQIQTLIGKSSRPQTALQIQLTELTQKLVFASLGFSIVIFFMQLFRRQPILESLKSAITLAVAAIPEGLPTVSTTILAQGVKKLEEAGVLIRRLGAIENLGTVNILCLDKTGTLTRNKMTVTSIKTVFGNPAEEAQLMRVAVLCNEADDKKGSPTEMALIQMAISAGIQTKELRLLHPLKRIQHRGEKRGFMSTQHQLPQGGQLLAVKGNPHEVLHRCRWYLRDGMRSPLTEKIQKKIKLENKKLSETGLRVLGFAFKESQGPAQISERDLTWIGLVGMTDPLRPEVDRFLSDLRVAGIRPMMITGDQAPTALSIGRKLGLGTLATSLESIPPAVDIFARVSPAHKLKIVQAIQRAGNVVAMTGDGINDGPALKTANVGIAMGMNGADVARKVADVVLIKDDLSSIITAIQEGRKIRENLKKSVDYIIAQNLTEILTTFISTISGLGAPLNPMQLLWINLITDILPELALAQEKPEENLLHRSPQSTWTRLIPKQDAERIGLDSSLLTAAALGTYLYGVRRYGPGPEAKTLAFLTINTASLLYTVAARSRTVTIFDRHGLEKNRYISAAIGAGFSAEILSTALPYLRKLLGAGRLSPGDLLLATAGSAAPLFLIEIYKFITTRLQIEYPSPVYRTSTC